MADIDAVSNGDFPIINSLTGDDYLMVLYPDGSGGFVPRKIKTSNMGINPDGGLLYTKAILNRSQIQALNSSPVTLISAPGENKSITITKCAVQFDPNGTALTHVSSNNYAIYFDYAVTGRSCAVMGGSLLSSPTVYRGSSTTNLGYSTNPNYNMALNEAVVIRNQFTDYIGGGVNASLKVYCWYQIIDFS